MDDGKGGSAPAIRLCRCSVPEGRGSLVIYSNATVDHGREKHRRLASKHRGTAERERSTAPELH